MQPIAYNISNRLHKRRTMNTIEKQQFIFGSILLLSNKLQALGDEIIPDITFKQFILLITISNLEQEEHSIQDIALLFGSSRQNTKKMIDVLAYKRYLNVTKSKKDSRSLDVQLTAKSYTFFEEHRDVGVKEMSELFSVFNQDDIDVNVQFLNKLLEQADAFKKEEI